ncbi:MAG: universal stress protein [Myxococcales bacterium]|nr:universal stress protein [Myxococcales bacterium]
MAKEILVPVDFSELSLRAVDEARVLAADTGAHITLVHVLAPGAARKSLIPGRSKPPPAEVMEAHDEGDALKRLRSEHLDGIEGVTLQLVAGESAAEAIAEHARALSMDMIVMTTHGRSGITHALLGSVAEQVIRHAPCPVLVVPHVGSP